MAKAKGKTKAKTKARRTSEATTNSKATKKSREKTKDVNPVEVRRNITNIVGNAASDITMAVVVEALKGQLATAKYLFEAAGFYPLASEGVMDRPEEDTLAQRLIRSLGLPDGPLPGGEDSDPLMKLVIPLAKNAEPKEKSVQGREGDAEAVLSPVINAESQNITTGDTEVH